MALFGPTRNTQSRIRGMLTSFSSMSILGIVVSAIPLVPLSEFVRASLDYCHLLKPIC